MAIIAVLFLALFLGFIGLDLYFYFKYEISRRFLEERIDTPVLWKEKLIRKNIKWLRHTPVLLKKDERRMMILDVIRGDFSKGSIQAWQSGALFLSLLRASSNCMSEHLANSIENYRRIIESSSFINEMDAVDYGITCYAALLGGASQEVYEKMHAIINENLRADGIVLYRKGANDVAFVDTIGFVSPFLCRYGFIYNDVNSIKAGLNQLRFYYENGFNENAGLPFHAIRISSNTPRGIVDWARGFAWYLIGLMESRLSLEGANWAQDPIFDVIPKLASKLVELQKTSGGFAWQLLSNGNTDSSATAVFGWFLINAYSISGEPRFLKAALKARDFLMRLTTKGGAVDFCQGDTKSVGVYSNRFEFMPFANAYALMLQNDIERYAKEL